MALKSRHHFVSAEFQRPARILGHGKSALVALDLNLVLKKFLVERFPILIFRYFVPGNLEWSAVGFSHIDDGCYLRLVRRECESRIHQPALVIDRRRNGHRDDWRRLGFSGWCLYFSAWLRCWLARGSRAAAREGERSWLTAAGRQLTIVGYVVRNIYSLNPVLIDRSCNLRKIWIY